MSKCFNLSDILAFKRVRDVVCVEKFCGIVLLLPLFLLHMLWTVKEWKFWNPQKFYKYYLKSRNGQSHNCQNLQALVRPFGHPNILNKIYILFLTLNKVFIACLVNLLQFWKRKIWILKVQKKNFQKRAATWRVIDWCVVCFGKSVVGRLGNRTSIF